MSAKKAYKVLAMGWSLNVSAHTITDREFRQLRVWANHEGYDYGYIPLSLEGILDGYHPASSNLWQIDSLPILDQNRFLLVEPSLKGVITLSAPLVENSPCTLALLEDLNIHIKTSKSKNRTLIYVEEFRGLSATWLVYPSRKPKAEDFYINYSNLTLGRRKFDLVRSVLYKQEFLEKGQNTELPALKARYSFIL